jgi:type I site-specific restriction endonuclease
MNIDKGFGEVISRLELKRDTLKGEFSDKYDEELMKFISKQEMIGTNSKEIEDIDMIYKELQGFIERNSDAKILTKINDISDFMNKSIEDLEKITRIKQLDRQSCMINPGLNPLSLNADKVFEIVTKFQMVQAKPAEQAKQ